MFDVVNKMLKNMFLGSPNYRVFLETTKQDVFLNV